MALGIEQRHRKAPHIAAVGVGRHAAELGGRIHPLHRSEHAARSGEVPEDVLISIVLPTRNRASVLPDAVQSVMEQVYGRWELLIVNDGSTDGTQEIIDGFTDERIRTFVGEASGVCRARNLALDAAKGDVIIYLDDDNWMEPLWLKAVAWAMTNRPDHTPTADSNAVLYAFFERWLKN